jgi:hypothetical protein
MATETTRETETTPAGTEAAETDRTDTGSTATATTGATAEPAATDTPANTGNTGNTDEPAESGDAGTGSTPAKPAEAAETTGTASTPAERRPTADEGTSAGQDAPAARASTGTAAGGGAVVGVGLGLASLLGTPLSDMLRDRAQLVGQIESFSGMSGDQVDAFYGAPWHTAALVNGAVALIAVIVGAVLLLGPVRKPSAPTWARPVALGGLVLGVLGLFVAGGMYIDLFAAQPALPAMPAMPGMPG